MSLLPCPFCGSDEIKADEYIRDGRAVYCTDCGARTHAFLPNADAKSRAAWNRRSISPCGRVEGLEPGDVEWLRDWMQPERLGWHNRERFKRILAALAASPPLMGWRLVPVEPTDEMLAEADSAIPRFEAGLNGFRLMGVDGARDAWSAMLAAAPLPPQDSGVAAADPYADRGVEYVGSNLWWTVRRVANGDARRPWYEISREDIEALDGDRRELYAALKEVAFYAETSGGTAGPDAGLQRAIGRAGRALRTYEAAHG